MQTNHLSPRELKQHLEERAYVYGVSTAVATLLGEYLLELLKLYPYVRHTNQTMV